MPEHSTLELTKVYTNRLTPKGRGVADDNSWEVVGALPDEEVLVSFGAKKKRRKLGIVAEVLAPSPVRVEPRCVHVPECGGCVLQQMAYPAQLAYKQRYVEEIFSALIEKDSPKICPIVGCEDPWNYRNKMEFSFSQDKEGKKFFGLMRAAGRGKVVALKECHIGSKWFTEVLKGINEWWESSPLKAYHHPTDSGHLRSLTLREAKQGFGKMAMLTVSGNPAFALKKKEIDSFVSCIRKTTTDDNISIFLQVHQLAKGHRTQFFEMLLFGPDHITEVLYIGEKKERLECKISPASFFQPNTVQAEKIYSRALEMVPDLKEKVVYDLYCGGATIGLSFAREAKQVIGIELNPHSVFDAQWNQEANKIENISIHRGDVGEVLARLKQGGDFLHPDVVIVDPPRSGLDEAAIRLLKEIRAPILLYISCNPLSQAENIASLTEGGYRLKEIQPIDQFPHTLHIENICLLM